MFPAIGKVARAPGRRTRGKGKMMRGRVGCSMCAGYRPEEWSIRVLQAGELELVTGLYMKIDTALCQP